MTNSNTDVDIAGVDRAPRSKNNQVRSAIRFPRDRRYCRIPEFDNRDTRNGTSELDESRTRTREHIARGKLPPPRKGERERTRESERDSYPIRVWRHLADDAYNGGNERNPV